MNQASKFRITFVVRVNKTTGKRVPVYVRISLNFSKTEFNTRCYVDPALWDRNRNKVSAKAKESAEINLTLDNVRKRILECYHELTFAGKEVTCYTIKQMYLGIDESQKSTNHLFDYHNKLFHNKLNSATLRHYLATQNYFRIFLMKQFGIESDSS